MNTPSTVLTLAIDDASFAHFDTLRRELYPPALNTIPAHLSLFHVLPPNGKTRTTLGEIAERTQSFTAQITGLRSLGRGVAYFLQNDALKHLQQELVSAFADVLVPQDRQGFRPHIVVQNKVTSEVARSTLIRLQTQFVPKTIECIGLDWWDYLGGPWQLRERFCFAESI